MSTKEKLEKYVGKEATVDIGGLCVRCTIVDYKFSYGKDRFQVTPLAGSGIIWIETPKLLLVGEEKLMS